MTTAAGHTTVADDQQPETEVERFGRIAREKILLEEGFEDARAG